MTIITKESYPRFIIDKPEGTDRFEGQSQNRIAENIVQFFTENNDISRKVIGIEGEWGSISVLCLQFHAKSTQL